MVFSINTVNIVATDVLEQNLTGFILRCTLCNGCAQLSE